MAKNTFALYVVVVAYVHQRGCCCNAIFFKITLLVVKINPCREIIKPCLQKPAASGGSTRNISPQERAPVPCSVSKLENSFIIVPRSVEKMASFFYYHFILCTRVYLIVCCSLVYIH